MLCFFLIVLPAAVLAVPETAGCTGCGNLLAPIQNTSGNYATIPFQASVSYDLSNRCEYAIVTCDAGTGETALLEFETVGGGLVGSPITPQQVVLERLFCDNRQWKYSKDEIVTEVNAVHCTTTKMAEISKNAQCTGCGPIMTDEGLMTEKYTPSTPTIITDHSNGCEIANVTCEARSGETALMEFVMADGIQRPSSPDVVNARLICDGQQWRLARDAKQVKAVRCYTTKTLEGTRSSPKREMHWLRNEKSLSSYWRNYCGKVPIHPTLSMEHSEGCQFAHVTCNAVRNGATAIMEFVTPNGKQRPFSGTQEVVHARLSCDGHQWKSDDSEVTGVQCYTAKN